MQVRQVVAVDAAARQPVQVAGPVHVIGATGRTGTALVRSLLAAGRDVVPVVRDLGKWAATGLPGAARRADVTYGRALRSALADAARIVCCAHARHTGAVIAAAPAGARFVFLGSTRKFSRWPDAHGTGVTAGETEFLRSGRPGVMLHPTMIYGAEGEDNVQRLAALLRRLPVVPLPGGGRSLVQPIYQDDVIRAIRAALAHAWTAPVCIVIAGPEPVPYAAFVHAVAAAAGLRAPLIAPLPGRLLVALAPLAGAALRLPVVRRDEARRLLEDKAFDICDMRATLGVEPVPLAEGLARTFARLQKPQPAEEAQHADRQ
ncbi:MAG TPA: NAD(P)-dependent oxidoreductase [Acetobacteraceae bacterium]|nr:NAD(P)-dependent oxidoreductase [Acetobacteraceae bacterium]